MRVSLQSIAVIIPLAMILSFQLGYKSQTYSSRSNIPPLECHDDYPLTTTDSVKALETKTASQEHDSSVLFRESLVHTAMLAHENPVTILVICPTFSGNYNDCGSVSKVLKHNTVQKVVVLVTDLSVYLLKNFGIIDTRVQAMDMKHLDFLLGRNVHDDDDDDEQVFDMVIIDSDEPDAVFDFLEEKNDNDEHNLWITSQCSSTSSSSWLSRERSEYPPTMIDSVKAVETTTASREHASEIFYESLVHPAMLAHDNPVTILVICPTFSGNYNDCGSVSQVLKHNTVEQVVVLVTDLSSYDLKNFGIIDARVEAVDMTHLHFLMGDVGGDDVDEEVFDMVIIDSDDPDSVFDFLVEINEKNANLMDALDGLKGIIVIPWSFLKADDDGNEKRRYDYIDSMLEWEVDSIIDYEQARATGSSSNSSSGGINFLVVFTELSGKASWYANEALVNLKLRQRLVSSNTGNEKDESILLPLVYFDSAVMMSYRYPPRRSENLFCHFHEHLDECQAGHGFDPFVDNMPIELLEVRKSQVGENAGRGVFATVDIPGNTYLALESSIHKVFCSSDCEKVCIDTMFQQNEMYRLASFGLERFLDGYGYSSQVKVIVVLSSSFLLVSLYSTRILMIDLSFSIV
jgi:spermidine synthase